MESGSQEAQATAKAASATAEATAEVAESKEAEVKKEAAESKEADSKKAEATEGKAADKKKAKPAKKAGGAPRGDRPPRSKKPAGKKKKETQKNVFQEPTEPPRDPVEISLRTLLEAGAHFGHQCSRWNPKMNPYIYTSRNGIHIIDLPKSVQAWKNAREAIVKTVASGKTVLFVGTKKQAQEAVAEEARRCGAFYVTRRWLGGMMTNFQTIRKSVERMKKVESILEEEEELMTRGETSNYKKKERLLMSKELTKLDYSLGGIRNMYGPPGLMFIVDIKREDIAIKEAARLDIPVVALVDTNCDPEKIQYPVPSNDDGTRAVRLFSAAVCDAVLAGQKLFKKSGAIIKADDFEKKNGNGADAKGAETKKASDADEATKPEEKKEATSSESETPEAPKAAAAKS